MSVVKPDPLPYASGPHRSPARWRRALRRSLRYVVLALLAGAGLTIAVITYRSPWIWYGSRDAYQWHRTLTFEMPPGQVVYEEDPRRVARLLALPLNPRTAYVGDPNVEPPPRYLERGTGDYFDAAPLGDPPVAWYVPEFYRWMLGGGSSWGGLVFLHERSGPAGQRRLVMVTQGREYAFHPPSRPMAMNVRDGLQFTAWSSAVDQKFRPRHGNHNRYM
jgi:hypothetical protein